ncbi:hypothetical protein Mycch_1234 [Mycolicibacterium chubuense NBB4]|uniref:DUF1330 domain-containing protein n=1 Tax=Mycolicibacterium chubuense (strain NBB4) TaxID=710421 RepID=I4BFI5_MYCCN|nr:DUF1330 domain-containing protein [Mycolicibacterium chubuense]AFM16042.1 hypothetical protein Mycch_1234 [Mycolicibacterium chubuense NBB4]
MNGERPDLEALSRLPADRPVVMVNLMKFTAQGRDGYQRYVDEATPHLKRIGARVRYAGDRRESVLGSDVWWDAIMVVEYPSPQAFIDMVTDPGYRDAHRLRNDALERHELIATTAWS